MEWEGEVFRGRRDSNNLLFSTANSSDFAMRYTAEVVSLRYQATSAPEYPISFTAHCVKIFRCNQHFMLHNRMEHLLSV
jgi:hypothetical protein